MKPVFTVRLDAFLADCGIAARRNIADILGKNTVTINGKKVTQPGIRFDPKKDKLLFNGKSIQTPESVYIMVHKPKDVISTASDEFKRKTVLDLVPSKYRLYPVGRLDQDTTGLLLLTNDGELANRLTHPRYHIPKTYELTIRGTVPVEKIEKFQKGVKLDDGWTAPAQAKIIQEGNGTTIIEAVLHQGKKRQIRRMCEKLRLTLMDLKRIAIGSIQLGNLAVGKYRDLTKEEVEKLKKEAFKEQAT